MLKSRENEVGFRSMSTATEFRNCYVIHWGIENFSMCIQKSGESLDSPPFKEESSHNQEWLLKLYPRGYDNNDYISFEFSNKVVVCDIFNFTVSVIDSCGFLHFSKEIVTLFLSSKRWYQIIDFIKRDDLFAKKISLLPNDILTLQCVIRKSSKLHSSIQSLNVERFSFTWPIKNIRKGFKSDDDNLFYPLTVNLEKAPKLTLLFCLGRNSTDEAEICLTLYKTSNYDERFFNVEGRLPNRETLDDLNYPNYRDCPILISFEVSAMDINRSIISVWKDEHVFSVSTDEETYNFSCVKISGLFREGSRILPHDTLLLLINYQLSNGSHQLKQQSFTESDYLQLHSLSLSEKSLCEKLYEDKKFCDVVLKVGNKSLSAHKVVLHSQSPVFRTMLESDMAEKNTGVIKIVDFDLDTMKRLLLLLYTEKLDETLTCEEILNLYAAAHKYEVLSLKYISSVVISKITVENVRKIFSYAAVYEDIDLKEALKSFILKHSSESLDMLMRVDDTTEHS